MAVSRTAVWAAIGRALGAREPDPHVRNPDWLAERLLGPEERALFADHPLLAAMSLPAEEAFRNEEVLTAARTLIPRTRFIDQRLEFAVRDGATQVVILGAGFDSRAYRLTELLAHTRVFEVDHPTTQAVKMRRVAEALVELPLNLTYAAGDFRDGNIGEKLVAAGYRKDQRTFFICEGVTMYLTGEAVRGTLRWIAANAPPGSAIVFDYTYEAAIRVIANSDNVPMPPQMRLMFERFKRIIAGEPWIFGIPDRAEHEFLAGVGLRVRKIMGLNSGEAVETYLTRADGSIFGNLPAAEQQGYLILEAGI